ncbi:hypothetical protein O181_002145 [Austropuccinia psidii MF-1]|uniref:Uncharacterized protein n=1 Tax=Austropuccinia psidii MF-1 TaxID=1389203 RepID=A0A9Q3GCJ3_9BASI|nr:hypothetical protein [Austropuccinia psidii MF-1]
MEIRDGCVWPMIWAGIEELNKNVEDKTKKPIISSESSSAQLDDLSSTITNLSENREEIPLTLSPSIDNKRYGYNNYDEYFRYDFGDDEVVESDDSVYLAAVERSDDYHAMTK